MTPDTKTNVDEKSPFERWWEQVKDYCLAQPDYRIPEEYYK